MAASVEATLARDEPSVALRAATIIESEASDIRPVISLRRIVVRRNSWLNSSTMARLAASRLSRASRSSRSFSSAISAILRVHHVAQDREAAGDLADLVGARVAVLDDDFGVAGGEFGHLAGEPVDRLRQGPVQDRHGDAENDDAAEQGGENQEVVDALGRGGERDRRVTDLAPDQRRSGR